MVWFKLMVCLVFAASTVYPATLETSDFLGNTTTNAGRFRRQGLSCGNGNHQCGSGECISEDSLCDGKVDCRDGSDETSACATIPCQSFLFRCAYGACINSDFECNGKEDCRDGSDENTARCKREGKPSSTGGKCSSDQFQCKSGQCIDDLDQCDGIENCSDGSDETQETCGNLRCQPFTFRCDYGACINENLRCNGKKNCRDNSDEIGCESGGGSQQTPRPTQKPTSKPTPTPTPPPSSVGYPGGCVLPQNPDNGRWSFPVGLSPLPIGTPVTANTIIIFSCDKNYKLMPENGGFSICLNAAWTSIPTCKSTCSSITPNDAMTVECRLDGSKTSCDNPYEGTKAEIKCRPLYEDSRLLENPYRFCIQGTWDYSITGVNCQPVCGLKSVEATQLVIGGKNATKGDYPWHVGIFRTFDKENVCGGSLVSMKVVVTAAHCFDVVNEDMYTVSAGKYYRSYKDPNDVDAQFSDIQKLLVHSDYNGGQPFLAFDIAYIILKTPFKLNKFVLPVCIDRQNTDDLSLTGQTGLVIGWGYTEASSEPSNVLKELEIKYKSKQQCKLPTDFYTYYLPYALDKLCAGQDTSSGQSACQGDSGGGLIFRGREERFFLRGVVSVAPKKYGGCDYTQNTLFTSLRFHKDNLLHTLAQYRV